MVATNYLRSLRFEAIATAAAGSRRANSEWQIASGEAKHHCSLLTIHYSLLALSAGRRYITQNFPKF
jgi:hypothetical protein